jgi:hypothetical protein
MTPSAEWGIPVEKVLAIIGPNADRREVERSVFFACVFILRVKSFKEDKEKGRFGIATDAQKKVARRFAVELRRLARTVRNPNLIKQSLKDDEGNWTSEDPEDFPFDAVELERWARQYEVASQKPLTSKQFRASKQAKRKAAREAAGLLEKHELPLKVSRRSKFCLLAALLYGAEGADFTHACRSYLRSARV